MIGLPQLIDHESISISCRAFLSLVQSKIMKTPTFNEGKLNGLKFANFPPQKRHQDVKDVRHVLYYLAFFTLVYSGFFCQSIMDYCVIKSLPSIINYNR